MARQIVSPALELKARHLKNAKIVANRRFIITDLPKHQVVTEVGVAFGDFSRAILDVMEPSKFYAVDLFDLHRQEVIFGMNSRDKFSDKTHEEFYRDRFAKEIANGQVELRTGLSADTLAQFPPETFDMVYIDAAHDYVNVKRDLEATKRVVKPTGTIIMNDYVLSNPFDGQLFGVVQATNEFCIEAGWEISHLALHPFMFCDVALKRLSIG